MACRQTIYARALRAKLIAILEGKCAICGATEDETRLQFDHVTGALYKHNQLSYSARMKRYEREQELGVLRLLCGPCNRAERKKNDNGQFIPTREAALVPLTADMPF